MKILITGASGLLGSTMMQTAGVEGHETLALDRSLINWHDPLANQALFDGMDAVVHAAANTNVEQCEKEPDACYRDNTLLTEIIAKATAHSGVKLAYISSTGVYGNHKTEPYCEYDPTEPTTHHHRSKLLAEKLVLQHCRNPLIIRTGWLFGGPANNPKNFVMRRVEEAQAAGQGSITSNAQQRGNPSYVDDVVHRLYQLLELEQAGLYNVVSTGVASRFDYVSAIIALAGLSNPVLPSNASHFQRVAQVSDNEAALNWKARIRGLRPMPDWQTSLARYMRDQLKFGL
jgi:dTDP-4-dehydrorhamnose reductase